MPPPRLWLVALGVGLVLAAASCASDPPRPELAIQRTTGGSFVIHLEDCDEPRVDEVRVVAIAGPDEDDLVVVDPAGLASSDPELAPTAVAFVPRNAWPPRLRVEVEGEDPFTATFDPSDVPPVDWQLLAPRADTGDEVVDLEDFVGRCADDGG